jgi:hypothetical protein
VHIAFRGAFTFASEGDVRDALAAANDVVGDEDAAFRTAWRAGKDRFLRQDGTTIHVDVDLQGPEDWYDAVEAICDELADEARTGRAAGTSPEGDLVVIDAEEIAPPLG